eukprot:5955701-Pleurochrysis_carterae.AAC.2
MAQSTGRVESPRCRLLAHDLKLLLMRFAFEESFSHYSKVRKKGERARALVDALLHIVRGCWRRQHGCRMRVLLAVAQQSVMRVARTRAYYS